MMNPKIVFFLFIIELVEFIYHVTQQIRGIGLSLRIPKMYSLKAEIQYSGDRNRIDSNWPNHLSNSIKITSFNFVDNSIVCLMF